MAIMLQAPTKQVDRPTQDVNVSYGHLRQQATSCSHMLHPSAPAHTPLCPTCVTSQAKAKMDAALKGLIAEGGLIPSDYMRDRRWQRAKLRYEIASKRQAKARSRDQLRVESEQTWEEAHQRPQHDQTAAQFLRPEDCPVCAATMATWSTFIPESTIKKEIPWWEQLDALVADDILVPRTPPRPAKPVRAHQSGQKAKGSAVLRTLVRDVRRSMAASDAHRRAWETRYRTESAVRRKHGLGEAFHFEPEFWDAPISAYISHQNYQHVIAEQRMAQRRARGNTARPRLPRSSLSYTALTEELDVDDETLEDMRRREEHEILVRQARKVGEEVGYLYFIGDINGMLYWRDDYLRSDRQLVWRSRDPEAILEDSKSEYAEVGSDEDDYATTEEEKDSEEEDEDEYEGADSDEDEEDKHDAMDIE